MAPEKIPSCPDPDESYLSPRQLDHFKAKLLEMQQRLSRKMKEILSEMREKETRETDILDRSDVVITRNLKLETLRRYQDQMSLNEAALKRIHNGTFGYCLLTGREIGLERLEAIPHAMLSIEAQVAMER